MIAAGALFYYASHLAASKRQISHDEVQVTIHPHSCEPNTLTVPAGRAGLRIVNRKRLVGPVNTLAADLLMMRGKLGLN